MNPADNQYGHSSLPWTGIPLTYVIAAAVLITLAGLILRRMAGR